MPRAERHGSQHRPVIQTVLLVVVLATAAFGLATAGWVLWTGLRATGGPAELVLVMGTAVEPDGTPGRRLEARLEAARRAHAQGLAPVVVVTSGRSPAGIDEASVMAAWLVERGVPADAVLEDPEGHNTAATAANLAARFDPATTRVLVVSQYFHLARTRLALRANGFREVRGLAADLVTWADPVAVLREVAAVWWYVLAGPERSIQRTSGPR